MGHSPCRVSLPGVPQTADPRRQPASLLIQLQIHRARPNPQLRRAFGHVCRCELRAPDSHASHLGSPRSPRGQSRRVQMHLGGAGALGRQAGARGGGPCQGLCPRRRCERPSSHPKVGRGRARPQAFAWKAGFRHTPGLGPRITVDVREFDSFRCKPRPLLLSFLSFADSSSLFFSPLCSEVNRGRHRPRWPPSPSDPPVLCAAPRQSGPRGAWRGAGSPRDWPKPSVQP